MWKTKEKRRDDTTYAFPSYIGLVFRSVCDPNIDKESRGGELRAVDSGYCFSELIFLVLAQWYYVLDFVSGHFGE